MPGINSQEFTDKIGDLKNEINKLEDYENLLDQQKLCLEQSIKNITDDLDTQRYLYVTADDITSFCGSDKTVISINLPANTSVTVQVIGTPVFGLI